MPLLECIEHSRVAVLVCIIVLQLLSPLQEVIQIIFDLFLVKYSTKTSIIPNISQSIYCVVPKPLYSKQREIGLSNIGPTNNEQLELLLLDLFLAWSLK